MLMIKKSLVVCMIIGTLGTTYAHSYPEGVILEHKEWMTGVSPLRYTLSSSRHAVPDVIKNSDQEEREYCLLRPYIESVDTDYTNPRLIHTQMKSVFQTQILGFYRDSEPQIFGIHRQICIIPTNDTPVEQVNCFNSKDQISVSSDINNSIDMEIDIYNLTPGKYIAEVQMSVEQIVPSSPMPISFSSLGNSITFTVRPRSKN